MIKGCLTLYGNPSHSYTERHLLCGITHCYLPPDTGKRVNPNRQNR